MELESSFDELTDAGLGVVAISYDTVEILASFADRQGGFRFSMLADPRSEIIERFGLRNPNPEPGSPSDGMAFPGTYIVDVNGIVKEKFFEQSYRQRYTTETVLLKTQGVGGGMRLEAELPQFKLSAFASQDRIRPGNRIVLVADFDLPDRMHLYAPGSEYTAADLRVEQNPMLLQGELGLPEPEILYLEPIDERVPVYRHHARIHREVTISPRYEGSSIEIGAVLAYQTCDDEICFPPAELPLTFELEVIPHDTQRAPQDIRH